MERFLKWAWGEFIRALPAILFFFVAFSLVDVTEMLMHKRAATTYYSFMVIAMAALVMGKVLIIADSLPFIGVFSKKPLIYGTLWKTFIYLVCSLVIRFLERAIPELTEGEGFNFIYQRIVTETESIPFWLAQTWLAVLILIFVAYQELVFAVGVAKVRKMFFGK